MNSRTDIKAFITGIEQKFPVNQWKANGIYIWPILRYHLYFWILFRVEKANLKYEDKNAFIETEKSKSVTLVVSIIKWFLFLLRIQKKEVLFFSPNHIRVPFQGSFFNRFFDSYIALNNLAGRSYVMDYNNENVSDLPLANSGAYRNVALANGYYKACYRIRRKFFGQKKNIDSLSLHGYDDFLELLKTQELTRDFAVQNSADRVKNYMESIFVNVKFFEKILEKAKPQKIYIICYYNPMMHALLIAAKRKNIEVVEVQHGPVADLHLCYSNWTAVPQEGYQVLADTFWCWDAHSKEAFEQWTKNTKGHTAYVGGNPWIDYLKHSPDELDSSKENYVLYTLQPLSFEVLFPEAMLNVIKNSELKWYLRLHPRQLDQKEALVDFLKTVGVFEKIEIEKATNAPLPLLLVKAQLHLTHFSGSAIEASILDKFTVVLDKLGEDIFKEIIQNQKAIYLPMDDHFESNFYKVIKTVTACHN